MILGAKTVMNTLKTWEAQNNLNECKVNVSFKHLCCEESLETLTCVIWGSEVVHALRKNEFSWFLAQKLLKTSY